MVFFVIVIKIIFIRNIIKRQVNLDDGIQAMHAVSNSKFYRDYHHKAYKSGTPDKFIYKMDYYYRLNFLKILIEKVDNKITKLKFQKRIKDGK